MPKYEDIVVLLSEQCYYFSHKTSWQQADSQTYRPNMKRVGTKHFLIFSFFSPNRPNLCPTNDALHIWVVFEENENNLLKISWFRYSVFIYLITFLAFVTIREKRNESKRFWFRVTISFRVALKSLCCSFGFLKKKKKLHSWASNELMFAAEETLAAQGSTAETGGVLFFCF